MFKKFIPAIFAAFLAVLMIAGSAFDATAQEIDNDVPLDQYWEQILTYECALCTFSGKFIEVADQFSYSTYSYLAPYMTRFVVVVLACWLIIQGGKLVVPFGPVADGAKIGWEVIVKLCVAFFVFAFLSSPTTYFDDVQYPFIGAVMELSNGLMSNVSAFGSAATTTIGSSGTCGDYSSISGATGLYMPKETIKIMTCQVEKMEKINKSGVMIGLGMIRNISMDWLGPMTWVMGALQFFSGAVLIIVFVVATLTFPLTYIDLIFRLEFIAALMPIFLAGFVVPWTSRFLSNAVKGMLASLMTLMCVSVVFGFVSVMISYAPYMFQYADGRAATSIAEVMKMLDNQEAYLTILEPAYFFLLVAGIMAMAMTKKVSTIVETIFEFRDGGAGMAQAAMKIGIMAGTVGAGMAGLAFAGAGMAVAGVGAAGGAAAGAMGKSGAFMKSLSSGGMRAMKGGMKMSRTMAVNPIKNTMQGQMRDND